MPTARILIVEDEAVVALDLRKRLTRLGYVIVGSTGRGEAAVQLAKEHRPDLVLMDIRLQGDMDGIDAAETIRSSIQLPVVYLTAHADEATVERARVTEPYGYILKPFDERELRTVIEMALYKHQAERRLRASERRFATTLSSIGDAVIATDERGCVTFMNPIAEKLTGWPIAEAAGLALSTFFRICDEETHQTVANPLETVLERSIAVGLANHTILVSRSGREFPIDVCAAPINDDQGGLTGAVLVFRDVTESRRIDEQLRHAQKMEAVGQLAGGVAHDFNNMLTVILNYTHLLMNAEKENPWNNYLNEIRRAGERSADLTRQLLTFCRKRLAEPNAQDLNEVIRQTEQMLHRLIGENIELETRLEPGLGTVLADSGVLEQVLINLAVNARDAISEQGKIVIETSNVVVDQTILPSLSCGVYRVLRVIDNGQGIPPELIARIFDPFFTTKELGKGTGLGLSTAYGIVQQCRGHIDVESTVGKGTTFTVYLPPAPEATIQDSAFSELELPKGTETVLLVEDEQSVRNLATHILSLCGYKVFAAENGTIAVQIASEHPGKIDIVVSDVVMPLMGAKIMLQLLKEHLPNLRVLLLSGHDDHGVVDDRSGIDKVNFLSKPFTLGEFTRSVRQTLDDLPVYLNARF